MRTRVTVIYKSGATMDLTCDEFAVRKMGSDIVGIEWDAARPWPLHVGVDEIAAVWEHVPEPADDGDEVDGMAA